MTSKRVQGRPRTTTVGQDLKDIASGLGRSTGGLVGNAASTLRNRGSSIDSAVHDRQHTDKANK